MRKNIANNPLLQNEYWNLITSTLSSYEVKDISSDGKIKRKIVKDDYFLVNDIWNIHITREMLMEPCKTNPTTLKNIVFPVEA